MATLVYTIDTLKSLMSISCGFVFSPLKISMGIK